MRLTPFKSRSHRGFSLIELTVVLVIIAILVAALIPVVTGVRDQAKESVVNTNTAGVSQGLANHASSNSGLYPGTMLDVAANFEDQAAGDNLTGGGVLWDPSTSPAGGYGANTSGPGDSLMWNGVLGGGQSSEKYASARQTTDPSSQFIIDTLSWEESLNNYPGNPFATGSGQSTQMVNVFQFLLDPSIALSLNNPVPYLVVPDNGRDNYPANAAFPNTLGAGRIEFNPIANGSASFPSVPISYQDRELNPFEPSSENNRPGFGTGTVETDNGKVDNFFSPGDFAYVPIINSGPYAQYLGTSFDPDSATFPDERFKVGTRVGGYYLFGYGSSQPDDELKFADEKQKFYAQGIPGFGNSGVDTQYEMAIGALFNGAVFFEKVGVN